MLVTFAWMVKQRDKINKSLMVMLFIQILLESCANASYHTSILNSYLTEDNFVQLAPSPNHRLQLQAKNQDQTHSQQPSTTDSRFVLQTRLISIVSKPIKVVVVVVVIVFAKNILIKNNPCPKTFRLKSVGSKKIDQIKLGPIKF